MSAGVRAKGDRHEFSHTNALHHARTRGTQGCWPAPAHANAFHTHLPGMVAYGSSFIVFRLVAKLPPETCNAALRILLLHVQGFLTALTDFQGMDRAAEGQEEYKKLSKCMDPIISTLANFHSEEHLGYMINRFFEYLDVDDNGYVSYAEMKKGMEKLDIQPKIKFSAEAFDEFTRDHEYTEEDGNVSRDNFEKCMRLELKGYAFRIAAHQMNQAVKEGENSNDYMYNKVRHVR